MISTAATTPPPSTGADEPKGDLTVRTIAMPADTNANGDIFGGWVLSQMDQAGGIAGVDRAQGRVVTVALDAMTFIRPVRVGDVLCVYTRITQVGRTSMKIAVEAWARRFRTPLREKVTQATLTFVAIDDAGRPRPIPAGPPARDASTPEDSAQGASAQGASAQGASTGTASAAP